jgi:hypothetical protein
MPKLIETIFFRKLKQSKKMGKILLYGEIYQVVR